MSPTGNPPEGNLAGGSSLAVSRLPTCEYCLERAEYLGATVRNHRKSYMCLRHFKQYGSGLGDGRGWKLVVMPEASRKP